MKVLVFFCVLVTVPFCYSSYPASWTSHNGTCYFFSIHQANWDNAMAGCHQHGGTLIEIKSSDVNRFLATQMQHHAVSTVWIGGKHDVRGSGWWMWMGSKTSMQSGYTHWAQFFPSDMYTRMIIGTRCALMKNGKWEDSKCDIVKMRYVCQK